MTYKTSLLSLYSLWKKDPKHNERYIVQLIDKIIFSQINRFGCGYRYKVEDKEDVVQGLRLTALSALNKIREPVTNKSITVYLTVTIRTALMGQKSKTAAYLDKEYIGSYSSIEKEPAYEMSVLEDYPEDTRLVADLLIQGYNKSEIKRKLNLSNNQLNKKIDKLKATIAQ